MEGNRVGAVATNSQWMGRVVTCGVRGTGEPRTSSNLTGLPESLESTMSLYTCV